MQKRPIEVGERLVRPLLGLAGVALLVVTAWRMRHGLDAGTLVLGDLWRAKLLWIGVGLCALSALPEQRFAPIKANLIAFLNRKVVVFMAIAMTGLFVTRDALMLLYDEQGDFGTPRIAGLNSTVVRLGPLTSFRNFLARKDSIDVMIFGTSVVWVLGDEKALADRHLAAFNARGITYGNPNVVYEFLTRYLREMPRLKYVVVGLHDNEALDARLPYADAIEIPDERDVPTMMRKRIRERLAFPDSTSFGYVRRAIQKNALGDDRILFESNGSAVINKVMTQPELHREQLQAEAAKRAGYPQRFNIDDAKLESLAKIRQLLAPRGIELVVMVSPYHQVYYDQIGYERVRRLIAGGFKWGRPLHSFAFCNVLTRDRTNYVDPHHPSDKLSEQIWQAVFGTDTAIDVDGAPFYRRIGTEAELDRALALVKSSCFEAAPGVEAAARRAD
jgi:hypothetical protein